MLTLLFYEQVDGQVIAVLVQNMERLDESVKEESEGVHNSLGGWCLSVSGAVQVYLILFKIKVIKLGCY